MLGWSPRVLLVLRQTAKQLLLSFTIIILLFCFTLATPFLPVFFHEQIVISRTVANADIITTNKNISKTLGIASHIVVVSLPRRIDRRGQMEILRAALDLQWTYVEAVDSRSAVVEIIMARVRMLRRASTAISSVDTATQDFRWPPNIDALSTSSHPLGLEGSDLWIPPTAGTVSQVKTASHTTIDNKDSSNALAIAPTEPLTCAKEDNIIPPYIPGLPEYKILTLAKIACWNSHLSVIRHIAEGKKTHVTPEHDVSVILEDDIDMEWDIRERLAGIWTLLPTTWDVVFIGALRWVSNF